jgi:hypothetical protein
MAETPWLDDAAQAAQRYEEAAAVAVEACAEDTAGQTCYICHGEGDEDEGLCVDARVAGIMATRTCRAWCGMPSTRASARCAAPVGQALCGGARAACASKSTTALCAVRLVGRAGRRTWVGRRRIRLG